MFFHSVADPDPDPFKVGDWQFWKEAGNNWKQQLEKYARIKQRILDKKREDWEKVALEKQEKEEQQEEEESLEDEQRMPTGQIAFAPKEIREARTEQVKKYYGLDKSAMELAAQNTDYSKLYRYIPPPTPKLADPHTRIF